MQDLFRSDRLFRVWAYTVSHKRLLLRSTEEEDHKRTDVFFGGVQRLLLKPDYSGLRVSEADAATWAVFQERYGAIGEGLTLFELESDLQSFVVAGVMQFHEDEGNYRSPSYFGHFLGA